MLKIGNNEGNRLSGNYSQPDDIFTFFCFDVVLEVEFTGFLKLSKKIE